MNETIDSAVCLRCPGCCRDNRHAIRGQFITSVPPPDVDPLTGGERPLFIWTTLQILECDGCGHPFFRQGRTSTAQLPGSWVWSIHSATMQGTEPSMAGDWLPSNVSKLQREIKLAMECGAHTLAAIGLRAAVEAVCVDRRCRGNDLQKRIAKLNGALRAGDVHLLHTHRALGNEAAHQMQTPSAAELEAARQLLDNTLRTLYELPRRAEDLKRLRAARLGGDSADLPEAC